MIAVSYADIFFIILALSFIYIFFLWRRENNRIRRNEWHLSNSSLFHCDKCHYSFTGEAPSLTRCPRCNAVCIKRKQQ